MLYPSISQTLSELDVVLYTTFIFSVTLASLIRLGAFPARLNHFTKVVEFTVEQTLIEFIALPHSFEVTYLTRRPLAISSTLQNLFTRIRILFVIQYEELLRRRR